MVGLVTRSGKLMEEGSTLHRSNRANVKHSS